MHSLRWSDYRTAGARVVVLGAPHLPPPKRGSGHFERRTCAVIAALEQERIGSRYSQEMGFRDWRGWHRLDELDRRSGFGPGGWWHRPWVGIALVVVLLAMWFVKVLMIGGSLDDAIVTVSIGIVMIAGVGAGGSLVERWLANQLGDRREE